MVKAFCPNCQKDLSLEDNVIITRESEIFKGHNVYVMCKHCGLVTIYNEQRESLFSLDRFQNDKEVVDEIKQLLEEKSLNVVFEKDLIEKEEDEIETEDEGIDEEVVSEIIEKILEDEEVLDEGCHGDCHNCSASCERPTFEDFYQVDEEIGNKTPVDLNDALYMVHKRTDERRFISKNDLNFVKDLDEWMFYEFQRVIVEPVVTYNIHKVHNA